MPSGRRAAALMRIDQFMTLRRQLGRGGVGIELGEGAVEVKQQNEGGPGRAGSHLGLHFI